MKKFRNLEIYNKLWQQGDIDIPIVILVGGAAGTGKTTLCESIMPFIPYSSYLSTTLIRSILRTIFNKQTHPELFANTFDLSSGDDPGELIHNFTKQSSLINKYIGGYFESIASEKQHYIIEGSNILPQQWDKLTNKIIAIDFYLCAPSEDKLYSDMLCGPTHNREIHNWQLRNCREIDSHILQQARLLNKPIFNYTTPITKILELINNRLEQIVNSI